MKTFFLMPLICIILSLHSYAESRPNIIFLMSDDQDRYSMGCYGNPDVKTPHLDKLSEDGVTFDRHYTTTAICMASRATVMTGMYEYKTGCNFDHGHLVAEKWQTSYPMLLRQAGYLTAFAGKVGFEISKAPEEKKGSIPRQDFDHWAGSPGQSSYKTAANEGMENYAEEYPHSTLSYGAWGRDVIKKASQQDKPLCMSISFKAPHMPVQPDPRFDKIYKGKTFTKPENFGRENGEHFARQSHYGRQYKRFHSMGYAKKYDQSIARYYQQVYAIDQAVGMIRAALDETGLAENTVIFYTSDHGFMCGSHGYGSKVLPYEESSGTPMIIYDPREKNSGKKLRSQALSCNIDLAPTFLKLAGLEVPATMDGKDMMELYRDPTAKIHDSLALVNVWGPKEMHALTVLDANYKYIYWSYAGENLHGGERFKVVEELYNITEDPLEMKNLANADHAEATLKEMRALYDAHLDHWKQEAVPYHNYQQYGIAFDRSLPWEKRKDHYIKTKWPEKKPPH